MGVNKEQVSALRLYGSTMVSVSFSHSSKDEPFVRDLAGALDTGGEIQVWLDEREIGYGETIVVKIGQGLDANVVRLSLARLGRIEWGQGRMDRCLLGSGEQPAHQARWRSLPRLPDPTLFARQEILRPQDQPAPKAFVRSEHGSSVCVRPRRQSLICPSARRSSSGTSRRSKRCEPGSRKKAQWPTFQVWPVAARQPQEARSRGRGEPKACGDSFTTI